MLFLRQEGFRSIQVLNLDAIKAARLERGDLIVLDIDMPILNGFDVAELLKTCRHTRQIPLIFLSAHEEKHYIEAARRFQAAAYVSKPVKASDLAITIVKVLAAGNS